MLYASSQRQQQVFDFTTFHSSLDGKGPRGKRKGVRSGSHLNGAKRRRADGHTNKHTGKQCPQQCRSGYLGPDTLGFLFQLTLLRAHGKPNEQGPSIQGVGGKSQGTPNPWLPPFPQISLSLVLPASIFLILILAPVHTKLLMLFGLSNFPKLDYSLSSPRITQSPLSHRISVTICLFGP